MNNKIFWLSLVIGFGFAFPLFAQQNLFNIPSGDITPRNKVFYQHQFNVYEKKLESKAHFVYGLGKGWDVGANLVGKGAYFTPEWRLMHNDNPFNGAVFPVLMGTVQKQFVIAPKMNLNVGTQAGFNLSNQVENKEFNHFTYALTTYQFKPGRRVIVGAYASNQMFVGTGNTSGLMLGYEWKLTEKWYLMGDFLSGRNDSAVSVIGAMYNVSKRVQLCGGFLLPNPRTPKPNGIVLELNILGWDYH